MLRPIKEYELLVSDNLSGLQNEVNEKIKANWQPYGTILLDHAGNYVQAVVLY